MYHHKSLATQRALSLSLSSHAGGRGGMSIGLQLQNKWDKDWKRLKQYTTVN